MRSELLELVTLEKKLQKERWDGGNPWNLPLRGRETHNRKKELAKSPDYWECESQLTSKKHSRFGVGGRRGGSFLLLVNERKEEGLGG